MDVFVRKDDIACSVLYFKARGQDAPSTLTILFLCGQTITTWPRKPEYGQLIIVRKVKVLPAHHHLANEGKRTANQLLPGREDQIPPAYQYLAVGSEGQIPPAYH
jgi:hypothetical protein